MILLFALIIVVAVFFLIGENSEGKKQYQEQIRQEAQDFTDELISELDKIDTSEVTSPAAAEGNPAVSAETPLTAPPEIITEAEKEIVSEELAKLEDEQKQRALQTLSAAYSKVLEQQKQEAFLMAERFVEQAKADWKALESSGEATAVKRGALISEYLAKSKVIEEQMDVSFETLIAKMEEQLNAEGIDPTAIIEQYRTEYKKIKEENKSALMDKAMAALEK